MNFHYFKYQNMTTELIVFKGQNESLPDHFPEKRFFITDSKVASLYADFLKDNTVISVPRGEKGKTLSAYRFVCQRLIELNCTKDHTLIAFGGGAVGDLTGFVAGTFKRGLDFIQVPTTLIGQVDAALGGKNALNVSGYKNQIGTIYQPHKVLIDPTFLKTLSKRDFQNGMAEIIKYTLLFNEKLFNSIEKDSFCLEDLIEQCLLWKGKITEMDEYDNYERNALNFGHTVGHALEKLSSGTIKHGEAIARGMLAEINNGAWRKRLMKVFNRYSLLKKQSFNKEEILKCIFHDKKRKNDHLLMVELSALGKYQLVPKTLAQLKEELQL